MDYGCVRYGFYPTVIEGVFADSEVQKGYDKYWHAPNNYCGGAIDEGTGKEGQGGDGTPMGSSEIKARDKDSVHA